MIKYFATNRSIEDLGKAVNSRDQRHKLQKGGYFFVNMEKYMGHFFDELETDHLPIDSIVIDSKTEIFEKMLSDPKIKQIVVCVHGFNVKLHEAFTWFRVLTDTMKGIENVGRRIVTEPKDLNGIGQGEGTAFIGFSWPSNGSVLSYPSDQRAAAESVGAFAGFLARLKKETNKLVNLICHSMGNFLACHTFAALVNEKICPPAFIGEEKYQKLIKRQSRPPGAEEVEREEFFIEKYIMIAPDVERRHITKCWGNGEVEPSYVGPFYSGLQHLVKSKINIYSRFDGALAISDVEKLPRKARESLRAGFDKLTFGLFDFLDRNPDFKWEKRLGEAPHPPNSPPGFESINATEIAGRKVDHSDHIDSQEMVNKISSSLDI